MDLTDPTAPLAVHVPASTSNLGPGFDVLGLAVDRGLQAVWHPGEGPLAVERHGTLAALRVPPDDDLVVRTLQRVLAGAGRSPAGGKLRLTSTVPVARGLGSSASARVAGHLLAHLATAGDTPWSGAVLAPAARDEGHPDNVAPSVVGGLVASGWSDGGDEVRVTPLPLSPEVGWCYACPGVVVRTDEARRALPATVPHALVGATCARLAVLLKGLATADGDAIAWGVVDEVHSPWRLPLVPGGVEAVEAARDAGAWGATLSGSGSGVIAMGPRGSMPDVRDALAAVFSRTGDAGDAHAFVFTPDPRGARTLAQPG